MYMHLYGYTKSRFHCCFGHSRYRFFHALPAGSSKFLPKSLLRQLPMWLSLRHLPLARSSQAKQPLAPVITTLDPNPTLLTQQAQRARQRGAIHGEARAQSFLIGLSGLGQGREEAELRDLQSCLSQLLVINPRDYTGEPAQVLARAGQWEECIRGLLSKHNHFHTVCIYIYCFSLSNSGGRGRASVFQEALPSSLSSSRESRVTSHKSRLTGHVRQTEIFTLRSDIVPAVMDSATAQLRLR